MTYRIKKIRQSSVRQSLGIGHESGVLMNGIHDLMKETSESSPHQTLNLLGPWS